jgi:hypothetical protein
MLGESPLGQGQALDGRQYLQIALSTCRSMRCSRFEHALHAAVKVLRRTCGGLGAYGRVRHARGDEPTAEHGPGHP